MYNELAGAMGGAGPRWAPVRRFWDLKYPSAMRRLARANVLGEGRWRSARAIAFQVGAGAFATRGFGVAARYSSVAPREGALCSRAGDG